jgi:DNA-binding response OmpR family regulator
MAVHLPCLKILRWDSLGGQASIPLNRSPLRLGRDPTHNDVTLPAGDRRISRQHLELIEEFGRWVLVDHSRNGVHVNGELVRGTRRELEHGDHVVIGDSVELLFDDPGSTFGVSESASRREGLYLDVEALKVWRDGLSLDVEWSPQEFALLRFLYRRRGQLCRYDEIIEAVWGRADPNYGRGHVHELVARVRRKLEPDPSQPVYLVTRPGHGYVLV